MFRAIEFLLLYEGTDNSLPSCDSKPHGLLRLIADEVPFRFIQLMMDADGPAKRYTTVDEFFKTSNQQDLRRYKVRQSTFVYRSGAHCSMRSSAATMISSLILGCRRKSAYRLFLQYRPFPIASGHLGSSLQWNLFLKKTNMMKMKTLKTINSPKTLQS